MSTLISIVLGATTALVDYGWQPLDEGGHEYIVQVPRELIDSFEDKGEGFASYVPPGVTDIRRIRIVVGSAKLPQDAAVLGAASNVNTAANVAKPVVDATSGTADSALKNPPVLDQTGATSTASNHETAEARTAAYRNESTANGSVSGDVVEGGSNIGNRAGQPRSSVLGIDTLTLTQIGLCAAIGLAVFVIFLHVGLRSRYRALLRQLN